MYYKRLDNNAEVIEKSLLNGFTLYTPEFQEGSTPSSREAIEILVANTISLRKDYIRSKNELLLEARKENTNSNGLNIKGIQVVDEKAIETLKELMSRDLIGRTSYGVPSSINSEKRRKLFDGLVSAGINYINRVSRMNLLLHIAPCFFEEEGIVFSTRFFQDPTKYSQGEGKYSHEWISESFRVRKKPYVDNPNKLEQRADVKLTVAPDGIIIKYVVYNRQDKLDVVAKITPDAYTLEHYHIEMNTPRERTLFPSTTLEFTRSASGNGFFKGKVNGAEFRDFYNSIQVEEEPLNVLVSSQRLFLGGNAGKYILDRVLENYREIMEAVRKAKQDAKSEKATVDKRAEVKLEVFDVKGLERKVSF
ncbi:MAG: hypothetical protein AABX03_00145 [Nanoarchaeota archaeon]